MGLFVLGLYRLCLQTAITTGFVVALFVTVGWLGQRWSPALCPATKSQARLIARLSAWTVLAAVIIFPAALLAMSPLLTHRLMLSSGKTAYLGIAFSMFVMLVLAWLLTPLAMKSLAEMFHCTLQPDTSKLAKKAAAAAVVLASLLNVCALPVLNARSDPHQQWLAAAGSLVLSVPYVLLFIAFGILTLERAQSEEQALDTPDFIPLL